MNKKKLVVVIASIMMILTIAIGGTLAYFTDAAEKDNVFTVGNVDITLEEPNWEGEGSEDAPEAYPGEALKKDPIVTNVGNNPCFVRIQVEGLDCLEPAGMITYRTDYVDGKLGDNWVLHTDGYFYYSKVMAKGDETDALFDQIVMPADLENGNGETEFHVVVKAEAVQAQGARPSFSAVQAMTVPEIAEWFGIAFDAE